MQNRWIKLYSRTREKQKKDLFRDEITLDLFRNLLTCPIFKLRVISAPRATFPFPTAY